jgi:hypothetical protein
VTPTVTPSPAHVSQLLTCNTGSWSGDGTLSFTYSWLSNGAVIPGQTGTTYMAMAGDAGHIVKCLIDASSTYGLKTALESSGTPVLPVPAPGGVPPTISGVGQGHKGWGEPSRHPLRGVPTGTSFHFALSTAADVTLTFTGKRPGRRVRGRCVNETKHNQRDPACSRTITLGRIHIHGKAGANSVPFSGRLPRRKWLDPGVYVLTITARVGRGPVSRPAHLTFAILG